MRPGELREELLAGRLRPAYLLAGEEPLLRDDALALLRETVLASGPIDFNFQRLGGDATRPAELIDAVRTLPVMAERRLVVLREPTEKRAGARDLLEALADLVVESEKAGAARSVLVVLAAKPDRRARWVKEFARAGGLVECNPPRDARSLVGFVRDEAQRQGVELERGVAELIAERIGPQLLVLRREIEKAALFAGPGRPVTREHAALSTSDLAEEPIWDLTDAIGEGRAGDALQVLGRLLGTGAPPVVVLGSLASHFRRLLRVRAGEVVRGGSFVLRKLERQAGRYRPERLALCLGAIHDTDEVLKGRGGVRARTALERLVLGLAG